MSTTRKSKKIKEAAKEFCLVTTAHGFGNIIRADLILVKLVWSVIVIISSTYCVYLTYSLIYNFLQYAVGINFQVIQEQESEFPSITICNLNPFDPATNKYAGSFLGNILMTNNITPAINVSNGTYAIEIVENIRALVRANLMSITEENLNKTYNLTRKDVGYSLETMLISCFYNGISCNTSDFSLVFTYEYGNCYTFNSQTPARTTKLFGLGSGLVLELFVGVEGKQDFYSEKSGIYVLAHNISSKPHVKFDNGVYVQTGTASNVEIARTFYSKLASPYSSCRTDMNVYSNDTVYFILTNALNTTYSQQLCFDLFKQVNSVIKDCKCQHPSLPIITNSTSPICSNMTSLTCGFKSIKNVANYPTDQECPEECDSKKFTLNTNSAYYPTRFYSNILMSQQSIQAKFSPSNIFSPDSFGPSSRSGSVTDGKTRSTQNSTSNSTQNSTINSTQNNTSTNNGQMPSQTQLSQSCLKVAIFYPELSYTLIEEIPSNDVLTLAGSIGGYFGLFLGGSFLTFAELVELIFSIIRIMCQRPERQKIDFTRPSL